MSSVKFLEMVGNSLINDKLLAETEIEHLITNKDIEPTTKLELIKKAISRYRNSSLDFTYWEDFVSRNVIIPKQEIVDGTNNPNGTNK